MADHQGPLLDLNLRNMGLGQEESKVRSVNVVLGAGSKVASIGSSRTEHRGHTDVCVVTGLASSSHLQQTLTSSIHQAEPAISARLIDPPAVSQLLYRPGF